MNPCAATARPVAHGGVEMLNKKQIAYVTKEADRIVAALNAWYFSGTNDAKGLPKKSALYVTAPILEKLDRLG